MLSRNVYFLHATVASGHTLTRLTELAPMSHKGKSGPTIGSASAPLISTAGTDHVIFSKKLLFIIGAIIAATVLIFFSVEQTQIQNNLAASRVALAQNNAIEQTGAELENAKVELESEEQE